MKNLTIVQIVGEARAGKSTVCEHLRREYDFEVILISDIIRSYAQMRDILLSSRSKYLEVFAQMKQELGKEVVADTVLEADSDRLCIDGNRIPADVERLKKAAQASAVIALRCPENIRFQRAQYLRSAIDPETVDEFRQEDQIDAYNPDPEMQNTTQVVAQADHHIDSSQSLDRVIQEVDEIIVPILANI